MPTIRSSSPLAMVAMAKTPSQDPNDLNAFYTTVLDEPELADCLLEYPVLDEHAR